MALQITLIDPVMPEGPIQIMGHPWSVELCDQPDEDDPSYISYRVQEREAIRIANSLPPPARAWQLWYWIWHALYTPLVWGSGEASTDEERTALCRVMWAGIRANAATVATWFGWMTDPPAVPEGPIDVLGVPWTLRRTRRIPGHPVDTYGLEQGVGLTLYVRSDLSDHFAAECALHELYHALAKGIGAKNGNEEAFIRPMALALSQVFFDNPEQMMMLFGIQIPKAAPLK